MFNIETLTTSKHPFIGDVEEIFGYSYRSIPDYVQGSSHPTILTNGYDQYFLDNLFKKVQNVDIGEEPATKTLLAFERRLVEQLDENYVLKLRLAQVNSDTNFGKTMLNARAFIHKCFSGFRGARIKPRFTFGATKQCRKGASIFERMKDISSYNKIVVDLAQTHFDYVPFRDLLDYPMLDVKYEYDSEPLTVDILTVWKTALGSRIIGLHDNGVMPIQNGFGDYLTNSILPKNCGIVISKAQELHKALAMEYSLTGEYGTSDQRNASNNILEALVGFLFPTDVFAYMRTITPRIVTVNGKNYESAMMCPQGNGFIFPLQTLIFYSLIWGIQKTLNVKHRIYVYGDDVILHKDVFTPFNNLLHKLYMEPNLDKSYCDDLIRESCGADFVYGLNVRALYVNNLPATTQDWIVLANGIRRIGYYNNGHRWRSMRYLRLWVRVVHRIPKDERYFCPRIYGDAGINTESEKRYQLSFDDRSINVPLLSGHKWTKYPNSGYNSDGLPFSSPRIKVYTSFESGIDGKTVIDELKGLPIRKVLRLLTDPSLSKAGYRLFKEDKSEDLKHYYALPSGERKNINVKLGFYPAVFNLDYKAYRVQKIPYSPYNQAPEDIDQAFRFISENSGNYITDTAHTLDIYSFKKTCAIRDLKDVLIRLVHKRDALANEANFSDDIF